MYMSRVGARIIFISLQTLMNAERIQTTVLKYAPILWGHMYAAVVLDIGWIPIDTHAMVMLIISGDKETPLSRKCFNTQISMSVLKARMDAVRPAEIRLGATPVPVDQAIG